MYNNAEVVFWKKGFSSGGKRGGCISVNCEGVHGMKS
jgi:hypothetical protein